MRRLAIVLIGIGLILGGIAGLAATAYLVGYLAETVIAGGSHLTNILFLVLGFVMIIATLLTLAERKWSALMQDRIGPNRARIGLPVLKNMPLAGIPHIAADVLKMLWKEDFMPAAAKANRFLFNLAPILAFAPVLVLFGVVPAGPSVLIGGHRVDMFVSDPDFGILYVFALASLAVYGTSLAGWSSNNKFALLGGVRASSQMISYEVALGLGLVGVMMAFSTVRLTTMADAQTQYLWRFAGDFDFGLPAWGIFLQPIGFILFFAAAFAETKRAPFDVPEGESEIIGYFLEYSGMKFGLFMISEFAEIVILAAISTVIFFGGWHLPFGEQWLFAQLWAPGEALADHTWLWGVFLSTVFWIKVLLLVYLQLAIRWTFPRFRYDQIQTLGWKMLLPVGLANVFITGALLLWDPSLRWLAIFGLLVLFVLGALTTLGGTAAEAHGPSAVPHGPPTSHGAHAAHPH
ncbi:MAG TPA: complex I subunit 1 family protein [Myxococcaceae bacterium]|nr:complex I subunit 1 family protein [Myxococcaceae bacterium]